MIGVEDRVLKMNEATMVDPGVRAWQVWLDNFQITTLSIVTLERGLVMPYRN